MFGKLVPILAVLATCSANQNLKWDDLEEEHVDLSPAEAPLLGRSSAIDLCPVPAAPKNSKVQCRKGRGRRMCRAICLKGSKLPDGETEQVITCLEDEGTYTPKESFTDCEAHCETPCQNGGRCIGNDECVCEAAFRGNLCQYPVSLCDGHFSEFLGTWRCGHKKNGTECQIGCPTPFYFSFESPKVHLCSVDGVWTPPKVPTCIADDPDLELVPGEVTRDEMEDKNQGKNKDDDHDEYEIYETINAEKPVEQANSIVIEAQDATNNIIRRIRCPEGKVRVKCASECQATCQTPNLVCPPADDGSQCEEGCACAEGFLQLGEKCVPKQSCPCYHEGFAFNHGHYIVQDCNTCTCHEGNWQCTTEVCDSECSVLVNTFYNTFDGHAYFTGAGPCIMVLMQVTNGVQIVQDRSSCPEESAKVCVGDLVVNFGERALRVSSDHRVMLDHREISRFPTDIPQHKIVIAKPSREFVQVNVDGISILTNGKDQISIKASPTFFNRTVGLCGTFNHQRNDDFTAPNNDVTTSAISFAEQWTVGKDQCRFVQARNCSSVVDQEERRAICDNLFRDATVFPTCLDKIAPEVHYEQCIEALCTCTSSAEECLCPFLSHYSQLCSNKGSTTDWTIQVPQCAAECHHGMRYQHCLTACHATCSHRSYFGQNCSESVCVEGCACPNGQSLSSDGVCVPYDDCRCYFDGREYQDGFRLSRNHEDCLCRKGLWECEVATEKRDHGEVVVTECGVNEVFTQCVDRCAPTCDALSQDASCDNSICAQGCQCADGFVRNELTGRCIKRRDCPCFHNGRKYNEGETVARGCNKCTCANSTWNCSNEPCPLSCDVWGNTHIKTFDNQLLDFEGTCDYVIAKAESDPSNAGWFQVVLRNFKCLADTAECRKSILIQYENQSIVLSGKSWVATSSELYLMVQRVGSLYTKVTLPNQITIYWDGDTRLHLIAGVQWRERVSGLCGNYNGDDSDELRTSSEGPLVHSVAEFVKGWQLYPQCKPPQDKSIVCLEPETRPHAEQKCQVLRSPLFEDCHNEVDVEAYFKRCVADACSCADSEECGCFCTAVSAYAHQCAQKGVSIRWRHQELCPLQCDGDCERYTPCVPEVCKNSQTCKVVVESGVQLNCAEPHCVEGCSIPTCKPGFVHPNETTPECLPASICVAEVVERNFCQIGDTLYREGQRIESPNPCVSCFCIRKESKCIGRPCSESLIAEPKCFEGWSDWKSETAPPSAFGHDVEYLAHHQCPSRLIRAVECRRIHDHAVWNESHQGVICNAQRGLECAPQDLESCADWEMRVLCHCPDQKDDSIDLIPVPDINGETGCPPGQQWSPCALNCAQTCHRFRRELMLQGQCLNQECVPGCSGGSCPAGQAHAGHGQCVPPSECPCIRPSGEIVAPGAVFLRDECTECQCLNNDFLCQRLSKCDQQKEGSEIEISRVDPVDGCWTQWISTDNAAAAGDFENLQELIKMKLVCENPRAIQCQTKESQKSPGGIDWTATGQSLTCDLNHGLSCFHMANPRDGCFDYQVKFYCPCDTSNHTSRATDDPVSNEIIEIKFYCPEPNGLFPDPEHCDHFYHCSNNFPFHKPCAAGTLFNPALKICDHPYNVDCKREKTETSFLCPSPMGFFPDVNNCHWFFHCVQNVAYHKLCPSGLSFNSQSGSCDFMANCAHEGGSTIVPVPGPLPMPIPVETEDSHIFIPQPMTFACPEAMPGSAHTCGHCPMGLLCDGFGSCVSSENCPCTRDGKAFPIGGRIESTTCQECICQIGGHSMCAPMSCPLCPNGIVGVMNNTCQCHCESYRVVEDCPKLCGNGQCLDPSRWCDGVVDCDNDETDCSKDIDIRPDPFPSYDLIHGPATCELIGNHFRTFDGQDLLYDYCHNTLAEDVANKLFRVTVSRECSSPSTCQPRVMFESGGQQIVVHMDSLAVSVDRTTFTPAQLATANFGDVSVLAVGDVVELVFRKELIKLVVTKDSVRLTADGGFKNQLMGLCGLFNYEIKDDLTNNAGMVVDNAKQFGDSWALPLSPGAICVSHACKPDVTIEAMRICEKLGLAPLTACTELEDSFRNCLAYTCQCLQTNKTEASCQCDAFAAFQKSCVDKHGSQIINKITGWRQQYSCVPKCPPDQEYQDCGPTCMVTCQKFFETGELSCASDAGACIPGCFCPTGFVMDYTTNTCIEPDTCADKVCVGYGDPQVKTFDGYSFSLDKSGAFNIATDRDGLFRVKGLNAPCAERLTCVVGLEVEHNGHLVKVQRNQAVTIDGSPRLEDALPWSAPSAALSVFSLQAGSLGTTVVSMSRLGVQVHYSHENAAFSIHVPSKKFFDKMEGLCGNCNNDPKDDLKLKDGETTEDIYGFICSWGHFETEQNRRECVMDFGRDDIIPPGPVIEACEQVFDNPTTFAGCHALVDYKPYAEQCSKETASMSAQENGYKIAVCSSALEYSRRCCEHGVSLQWWTNLGCDTTCPGDLIYTSCTDACPQTCVETPPGDECRKIRMHGCVCPPDHVRNGDRCTPKAEICTTPAENCEAIEISNSVQAFEHLDQTHGLCTNPDPIQNATMCSGACASVSLFKHEYDVESSCGCCVPFRWTPILIPLRCADGELITREFRRPLSCKCEPCGTLDSRQNRYRALPLDGAIAEGNQPPPEVISPMSSTAMPGDNEVLQEGPSDVVPIPIPEAQ